MKVIEQDSFSHFWSVVKPMIEAGSAQYETIPEASEDNVGTIIQYTGETNENYTKGHFYEVVSDGAETPTYSWKEVEVQRDTVPLYVYNGDTSDATETQKLIDCYNLFEENRPFNIVFKSSNALYELTSIKRQTDTSVQFYFSTCLADQSSSTVNEAINRLMNYGEGKRYYVFFLNPKTGTVTTSNIGVSYLTKSNALSYTPTGDYNPATKKYVDDTVASAVSGITSMDFQVVEELPTEDISSNTIYLLSKTGSEGDVYDEYLYVGEAWEKIGSTDIDLSNYVTNDLLEDTLSDYMTEANNTQQTAMPEASADNVGKVIQYVGESTENYTKGYFYEAVSDGESEPTYSWENLLAQNNNITTLNQFEVDIRNLEAGQVYYLAGIETNPSVNLVTNGASMQRAKGGMLFVYKDAGYNENTGTYIDSTSGYAIICFVRRNSIMQVSWNELTNILAKNNTTPYVPTSDYNPATKKYVDDSISNIDLSSYATTTYVDNQIGDISSALSAILGE